MRIIVIPQKMSGTGTIHDVASADHDRLIAFKTGEKYAVLPADYFRVGYTTHRTKAAAIKAKNRLCFHGYPSTLMDDDGWVMEITQSYDGEHLEQTGGRLGEPSTSTW